MNRVLSYRLFLPLLFFLAPLCLLAETQGTTGDFPASATSSLYTVKKGDCLWNIAKRLYKNPFKWPLLYRHNESLIQNPDRIEIGWKLSVPLAVNADEVNQAIQFASDYKEAVHKKTHQTVTAPTNQPMASTEKPPGVGVVGSNPEVPSSAPAKQEQPSVSSSKPEESQTTPAASIQQPGGSIKALMVGIILLLLAGVGIWWWKVGQANKVGQEPFRMAEAQPSRTGEQPSTPSPVAEKLPTVMTPPTPASQRTPQAMGGSPTSGAPGAPPSIETSSQPVMPQPAVSPSSLEPVSTPTSPQASAPITPPPTPEAGQVSPKPEEEKPKNENHRDVA